METKAYLKPVSLGLINKLYNQVSLFPTYTRIMRRFRVGVQRKKVIDTVEANEQQRLKVLNEIETIQTWLDLAKKKMNGK